MVTSTPLPSRGLGRRTMRPRPESLSSRVVIAALPIIVASMSCDGLSSPCSSRRSAANTSNSHERSSADAKARARKTASRWDARRNRDMTSSGVRSTSGSRRDHTSMSRSTSSSRCPELSVMTATVPRNRRARGIHRRGASRRRRAFTPHSFSCFASKGIAVFGIPDGHPVQDSAELRANIIENGSSSTSPR